MPTNKNFAYSFSFIFFILFLVTLYFYKITYSFIPLALSLLFLILGKFNPDVFKNLNKYWYKFAIILHKIISPVIIFILYYFIFCPYGITARIFSKKINKLSGKTKNNLSNWNDDDKISDFEKQY